MPVAEIATLLPPVKPMFVRALEVEARSERLFEAARNAVELKAFEPKEEVLNVRTALVVVVETEMYAFAELTPYEASPVEVA